MWNYTLLNMDYVRTAQWKRRRNFTFGLHRFVCIFYHDYVLYSQRIRKQQRKLMYSRDYSVSTVFHGNEVFKFDEIDFDANFASRNLIACSVRNVVFLANLPGIMDFDSTRQQPSKHGKTPVSQIIYAARSV